MKLRLDVSSERYDELAGELRELGIEIDEGAELVLSEVGRYADYLVVRVPSGGYARIGADEIITVEAFGRDIEVHTQRGVFLADGRLYQMQSRLDPARFLRVSNSVIVALGQIRQISPALSMRFTLTLSNGRRVIVTRTYYYAFKDALGI